MLLEGRERREIVLGNHTVHLGLAELDNTLAQVAQILEQIVVVGINEFPLKSQLTKQD